MQAGTATGEGNDTLISIENATGSIHDDTITGNAAANVLNGFDGADTLDGGAGADTLAGGAGDDVYIVDASDVIVEASGAGADTIQTSVAIYTLATANVENLSYSGGGNFTGTGNSSANVITGGVGNDRLYGAGGVDTLIGGTGDDTYLVDVAGVVMTEVSGEGTDTVRSAITWTLGANIENLTLTGGAATNGFGNAENNIITGNAAANTLKGFGGDDTLDGGLGADTVSYTGASGAVTVNLQAGTATGEGNDTLISIENATGSIQDDTITGNASANILNGYDGADTLDGGAGADTLAGGVGNDVYIIDASDVIVEAASAGTDEIQTNIATYTITAANVENLTYTGSSDFTGTGNALNNVITGASGNDRLYGVSGADTLIGGLGNDTYLVADAAVTLTEASGEGADTVRSSVTLTLAANIENLTLTGGAATNGFGNVENNVITGNAAANTLGGGLGADTLTGGLGNDTFVFDTATGGGNVDTITDFAAGADKIRLDSTIFSALGGAGVLGAGLFVSNTAAQDGDDYLIYDSTTGALYYDDDGSGANGQVQIATLTTGLTLSNTDFLVT